MRKPKATPPTGRLAVEYRKRRDLMPYANNARTHSPEQVQSIANSIVRFGWTNPILIDGDTILAGHGRMAAATLLDMEEVPVIVITGLSPEQKRALVIADNQIALNSDWNFSMLREEMPALEAEGFDMTLLGNIELPKEAVEDPVGQVWKTPVIKFNITFDNAEQQQAWFEFVRRLQQEFPSHPTLASRLVDYLKRLPAKEAA
jgi:ParB-like nuclease domain